MRGPSRSRTQEAWRARYASDRGRRCTPAVASDIEIRDRAGVVLDERTARLDLVAHELGEDAVGGGGVLERDLGERSRLGRHRRFAELVGVHLAEPLEAL